MPNEKMQLANCKGIEKYVSISADDSAVTHPRRICEIHRLHFMDANQMSTNVGI